MILGYVAVGAVAILVVGLPVELLLGLHGWAFVGGLVLVGYGAMFASAMWYTHGRDE